MLIEVMLGHMMLSSTLDLAEHVLPNALVESVTIDALIDALDPDHYRRQLSLAHEAERIFWINAGPLQTNLPEAIDASRTAAASGLVRGMAQKASYAYYSFLLRLDLHLIQQLFALDADIAAQPYYKTDSPRAKRDAVAHKLNSGPVWQLIFREGDESLRHAKVHARAQWVRLALMCKLYQINHGRFPAALDQLPKDNSEHTGVDPLTGMAYEYELLPDGSGFRLTASRDVDAGNSTVPGGYRWIWQDRLAY